MPKEEGSLSEKIKRIDFAGTFSVIGKVVKTIKKKIYIYIYIYNKNKDLK